VVCAIAQNRRDCNIGILCTNSNATIADCAIVGNRGINMVGVRCDGGAPSIIGCTISQNVGTYSGGGESALDCANADATIADCTITLNEGHGIVCSGGNASITGCTIVANTSCGIRCSGSTAVSGCTIVANGDHGIYCSGTPTITGCLISANRASNGGGVYCYTGTPAFSNCRITMNTADSGGGGVYCYRSDAAFSNCVFAANEAGSRGGAVYCYHASPRLINCTVAGNRAEISGGGLCLICESDDTPTVANCILWNDSPDEVCGCAAVLDVTHSDIQGGYPGTGNLDIDPLFALAHDPRLIPGSPCIDAGTNAPPGGLPLDDFDGNPRVLDGDGDGDAVADMGACEFSPDAPAIACSPAVFEFVIYLGDPNPHERTLSIRNCGTGTLHWEIVEEYAWLDVDTPTGESSGETDDGVLSVNANELAQGLYAQTITVVDPQAVNSPQTILVMVRVWSGYPVIQTLIDAAFYGDTVIVADGLYTGPGNKNLDFRYKPITLRSAGGPENCIIDCQGDGRGFHFHSGEAFDSVVDGFTVINGYYRDWSGGGAVLCEEASSPVFANCVFRQNTAIYGAGGVSCSDSSPTFVNCAITENAESVWGDYSVAAGGVSCSGGSPAFLYCSITHNRASFEGGGGGVRCRNSSPTFSNCTISGNSAFDFGGGICASDDVDLTLTDCTITENTVGADYSIAGYGGGIACGGNTTIVGCTVSGNAALGEYGGGVWHEGPGDLIVANSTISDNAADFLGGGLFCSTYDSATVIVTDCVITGNTAFDGGGVHCWAGWADSPVISNCAIADNTAVYGGGVSCFHGTIANCVITGNTARYGAGVDCSHGTIANCTITRNIAEDAGGGVRFNYGDPTIDNSVLWANTAPSGPEIALAGGSSNPPTLSVSYSDVHGGQAAVHVADGCTLNWGAGNIDADPLYADPNAANFHLSAGSPCIDAGDNTAVPLDVLDLDADGYTDERTPFDLDGNPRFVQDPFSADTGVPDPPRYWYIVDMGAYEYQFCFGDLDEDDDVDVGDLAQLLCSYGAPTGMTYYDGDLDGDGDVDLADLAELLGQYGTACG
jgi:parallel beta-helix repeat protein